MAASVRKFEEGPPSGGRIDPLHEKKDHIAAAEKELLDGAAEERIWAQEHIRTADDLERRARGLREDAAPNPHSSPSASPMANAQSIQPAPQKDEWKGLKVGPALEDYLARFDNLIKPKMLTELADILLKGGVKPGKAALGANEAPQNRIIANIRRSAKHHDCECSKTQIWRIRKYPSPH